MLLRYGDHAMPGYGMASMDVEVVCTAAADSKDMPALWVRSVRIAGELGTKSMYPFKTKSTRDSGVLYESATMNYEFMSSYSCIKHPNRPISDDEVLWGSLRSLLTDVYKSAEPAPGQVVRGISLNACAANSVKLTIPKGYGGPGTLEEYKVEYGTYDASWKVGFASVRASPLEVQLTSSRADAAHTCLLTFSYYGSNVTGRDELKAPTVCSENDDDVDDNDREDSSQDSEAEEAPDHWGPPMPTLPFTFSADFQVVIPAWKSTYMMRESFMEGLASRSTVEAVHPDALGRAYYYDWTVLGDQMKTSYFQEIHRVPDGNAVINEKVQDYFWPNKDTCRRALIGYDTTATTSASLLMVRPKTRPMFLGNQTVRNIPCGVWSAYVDGSRVTWYWASNESAFADEDSYFFNTEGGKLVRMVVEGTGEAAPLFVHHPFFAQGYAFPKADRNRACHAMTPDLHSGCTGMGDGPFLFYYDITHLNNNMDFIIDQPESCKNAAIESFPGPQCVLSGNLSSTVAAVLLVVIALLSVLLGSCCVWCRYAPMVRGLQEEVVSLTQELRQPLPDLGLAVPPTPATTPQEKSA